MTTRLSAETLATLADRADVPGYDRAALRPGIVHIGVGNFHRAHQAVYLDRLFRAGLGHDWALIGAGVMPGDAAMRETLAAQDYLTTVVEQDADGAHATITAGMIDFLPAGDAEAIVDRLSQADIRIASMTITEGGYSLDSPQELAIEIIDIREGRKIHL